MDRELAIERLNKMRRVCDMEECNINCELCDEALDLAIEALQEKLQLSGETSTNTPTCNQKQVTSKLKNPHDSLLKPDSDECKEQKSKLDCISRQDAIEALMAHFIPQTYTGEQVEQAEKLAQKIMNKVPPVNQKQITGKLESAENATSEGEESTIGQPKSKLDCISRQQAINAVENTDINITESEWDELINAIDNLPPVTPINNIQKADALIIATALRDFAQDSERNISDRQRACKLREPVLVYGASMCKPVTPTERTGEWKSEGDCGITRCNQCGWSIEEYIEWNYCPNCGCKMGGDE